MSDGGCELIPVPGNRATRTPNSENTADKGALMNQPVVESIHIATASKLPMNAVTRVLAEQDKGLVGDRHHGAPLRQVTIQASGELAEAAANIGRPIEAGRTRRNITISADSVQLKTGHRWSIGSVELEVTRETAPCALMEELFGAGAIEALKHRAGVACRVVTGGEIAVGDTVDLRLFPSPASPASSSTPASASTSAPASASPSVPASPSAPASASTPASAADQVS